MRRVAGAWSGPADVTSRVRRRWDSGELLSRHARDLAFEPVEVPLRGPRPGEIAEHLAAVREWAADLESGSRRRGGSAYRLETRVVGGRLVGANAVPVRAVVDDYEAAWRLLGVEEDVSTYHRLLQHTRERLPVLADWVCDHPLRVLALAPVWPQLLDVADWIAGNGGRGLYLRQIDVAGIDTKFVEQHARVLRELVDALRPTAAGPGRIDLAARYGYLTKPRHVRVRFGPQAFPWLPPTVTEAALRVDQLATLEPAAGRVFVLENEITYLALPLPPGSLVMFGAGYTVGLAGSLPWLAGREVVYWGDLDTHGFAILNRLRAHCPQARSLLMDRRTLLDHRDRWVTEPTPTSAHLDRLTPAENDLYQDLVEGTFGPAVRLEQERISWPAVEEALASYDPPSTLHDSQEAPT